MKNINECKVYDVPDINMKETGKNIKNLRIKNCLKVSQLQNFFGFDYPQAIYDWEAGKKMPNLSNLVALAALYEISLDSLIIR